MKKLITKGRYLAYEDGSPFFYLADTAWELFHRLSREEADEYLKIRSTQEFTVIQAVALAECEGLTVPNYYGRLPLNTENLFSVIPDTEGDYSYWAHVDYIIQKAAEYGLYVAFLPTWGDKFNRLWGVGPQIFDEKNAYTYGKWIGARYREYDNIIWMLGGDRPLEEKHRCVIDNMAKGIRDSGDCHIMTFHPSGASQSTQFVGDADYIDFHSSQTGHDTSQCYVSNKIMLKMRSETEKPYLDSEPRYEDHPACFNPVLGYFWDAADVRQNAYRDVLSGACGHTYGNHCVWSMTREPSDYFPYRYDEVLTHPGAEQMRFVRRLREERDYFSFVPCSDENNFIVNNYPGMGRMVSGRGDGYSYIYDPLGLPITLNPEKLFGYNCHIRALWFNPRTGEEEAFALVPSVGENIFVPEKSGKNNDIILILESR